MHDKDPTNMIITKNENRLAKDVQDEKGMTKEKVIESLLKIKLG